MHYAKAPSCLAAPPLALQEHGPRPAEFPATLTRKDAAAFVKAAKQRGVVGKLNLVAKGEGGRLRPLAALPTLALLPWLHPPKPMRLCFCQHASRPCSVHLGPRFLEVNCQICALCCALLPCMR